MNSRRMMSSDYMNWAKTRSAARFNLAVSGVVDLTLAELGLDAEELESLQITRGGGYGYPPLQEALAARLGVAEDSIVAATGTSLANHLAMAALIQPGDEVLIERPTYEPLLAVASYLGANVKRFDRRFEDDFRIVPGEIEEAMTSQTRLIVFTNLHNPSGVLTEEDTLLEIAALARRAQAHVLIDEVYLEALFERRPPITFRLGDEFVVTSSLTKAFGLSGLRCGWIVAAPDLACKIWRLNDLFGVMAAHPAEQLSVLALNRLEAITARAKSLLKTNSELVNRFLDARSDLEAVRPQHGTIVFPRLISGNTEKFVEVLREKYETSVAPGKFFEMPAHFRLGFSCRTETLSGGLERLSAALEEFGRS